MPFSSLSGAIYIKNKITYGISFAKCARVLLSERLADAHSNVEDSHHSNRASVAQSVVQHGRLQTAILSATVENIACVVFLHKHGLRGASTRILPMARLRRGVILGLSMGYLSSRAISFGKRTGQAVLTTTAGKLAMHLALTTHFVLCNMFGNDFIHLTPSYIWRSFEWALALLADILNEAINVIVDIARCSTAVWAVYTLALNLLVINLCSVSVAIAFLSVYTCDPCDPSLGCESNRRAPGQTLLVHTLKPASSRHSCPVEEPTVTSPTEDEILSTSVYGITRSDTPAAPPRPPPFFQIDSLYFPGKENGTEILDQARNKNEVSVVDTANNVTERKTEGSAAEPVEVELDSGRGANESIRITITACSSMDELASSRGTANILENHITKSDISTAREDTTSDSFDQDESDDTYTAIPITGDLLFCSSSNDPNKENRFLFQTHDKSLSYEVRKSTQRNGSLSFSVKENDPRETDLTISRNDKGENKATIEDSSSIDMLAEILGKFNQIVNPDSKSQISSKASFSVHLDVDITPVRAVDSFQLPPAEMVPGSKERLDLFSIAINYHEENYQVKGRVPPSTSKLYEKYSASIPDVSINEDDEFRIASKLPSESIHITKAHCAHAMPLTPSPSPFTPRNIRTNGSENAALSLPHHWSPPRNADAISIIGRTSSRWRARLGALATGDKRKDYLTRRALC